VIVTCFRFTDFCKVVHDLQAYSRCHFTFDECRAITDKTEGILEKLSPLFADIYLESLYQHPTPEMEAELQFIELKTRSPYEAPFSSFKITTQPPRLPTWCLGQYYLQLGIYFKDLYLYAEAIEAFNEALRWDANLLEAYIERAHDYLELNEWELALTDGEAAKTLTHPSEVTSPLIEFGSGLYLGIREGLQAEATPATPPTWSCHRGISHGLWAQVDHPFPLDADFLNTSYDFLNQFCHHASHNGVEKYLPELQYIISEWEELDDSRRGSLAGYLIGKHGLEIFLPEKSSQLLARYRRFEQLNTMMILECCLHSEENRAQLIQECNRYAETRKQQHSDYKEHRILPFSPHLNQTVELLEREEIDADLYRIEVKQVPEENPQLLFSHHEKEVQDQSIHAIFVKSLADNKTYLLRTWME
jgi:hypothetical protein